MNKQYNGLDLLKFVMALMVVMIHVKPNVHSELLTGIFKLLLSITGKMGLFCGFVGDVLVTNWLYYIFVIAVSIAFSEIILRLEKYKFLKFLRYTH